MEETEFGVGLLGYNSFHFATRARDKHGASNKPSGDSFGSNRQSPTPVRRRQDETIARKDAAAPQTRMSLPLAAPLLQPGTFDMKMKVKKIVAEKRSHTSSSYVDPAF